MSKLQKLLKTTFNQYLELKGLSQGQEAVPVDVVLESFKEFAPEVPISKSQLGRLLSKKFLKRQLHYHSSDYLTQCYFLNKKV